MAAAAAMSSAPLVVQAPMPQRTDDLGAGAVGDAAGPGAAHESGDVLDGDDQAGEPRCKPMRRCT
jgi:hypothetical protein